MSHWYNYFSVEERWRWYEDEHTIDIEFYIQQEKMCSSEMYCLLLASLAQYPKVSNCAGVYRLEHNYIVRYIKMSQLHVSALMAIFRLDTKLDEKTIYNMVHYIHNVHNVPYYI